MSKYTMQSTVSSQPPRQMCTHFRLFCSPPPRESRVSGYSWRSQFGPKSEIFFLCDLKIWRMTLKNNRAPLLSNIKLCASFHCNMWIQTGVTVRKRLNGVMTSVTLTFDPWPWPYAWTSRLSMVITPENVRMIRWEEHCQKGVTDRQTDGRTDRQTDRQTRDRQTDRSVLRAAWSQLKVRSLHRHFYGRNAENFPLDHTWSILKHGWAGCNENCSYTYKLLQMICGQTDFEAIRLYIG